MATEKRLIDANDLWSDIMKLPHNGDIISSEEVEQAIKDAPIVDAVEVVHGRWERMDTRYVDKFKCSVCRSECYVQTCMGTPMYDYCPNCGAKMDGDGNVYVM